MTAAPEVFGLHDNASITRAQSDTAQLLKSILLTESSGGGSGGADKETTINNVAADILSKVFNTQFFYSRALDDWMVYKTFSTRVAPVASASN